MQVLLGGAGLDPEREEGGDLCAGDLHGGGGTRLHPRQHQDQLLLTTLLH